ncbi:DUF6978 family protein [Companilactobacillus baiquanensis]|uniref:DUF6978 family protein n=1 Tax=Companilactobacillus baiquanensis TaxID=2486005 RepID=A0ABW1UUK6_9LACO|nr:hypothetical protein [Companilactobacillus baiquanensis]
MDLKSLSEDQVQRLLQSLKKCVKAIPNDTPIIGRIKDDTPVVDFENHIEYILHRYRNNIDNTRFSLHIRFKETNEQLIRVDINNGTHINPDGEKIHQNHMHIYKYIDGLRKDSYAHDLPDEINDIESLFSTLVQFLEYSNTEDYPN